MSQLPNARWMQRHVFLDTGLSIWSRTGSNYSVLLHIDYHSNWEEKSLHMHGNTTTAEHYHQSSSSSLVPVSESWVHLSKHNCLQTQIFCPTSIFGEALSFPFQLIGVCEQGSLQQARVRDCSFVHKPLEPPVVSSRAHTKQAVGSQGLHHLHSLLSIVMLAALVVIQPFSTRHLRVVQWHELRCKCCTHLAGS